MVYQLNLYTKTNNCKILVRITLNLWREKEYQQHHRVIKRKQKRNNCNLPAEQPHSNTLIHTHTHQLQQVQKEKKTVGNKIKFPSETCARDDGGWWCGEDDGVVVKKDQYLNWNSKAHIKYIIFNTHTYTRHRRKTGLLKIKQGFFSPF